MIETPNLYDLTARQLLDRADELKGAFEMVMKRHQDLTNDRFLIVTYCFSELGGKQHEWSAVSVVKCGLRQSIEVCLSCQAKRTVEDQ